MSRRKGAAAAILAGFLLMPVTFWPSGDALGQGGSPELTEQKRREMEQKYQEQWETRERIQKRQEDTGQRLKEAEKRRQDAEQRLREAERQMQEMEQKRGK
jgi:hypothetical protein